MSRQPVDLNTIRRIANVSVLHDRTWFFVHLSQTNLQLVFSTGQTNSTLDANIIRFVIAARGPRQHNAHPRILVVGGVEVATIEAVFRQWPKKRPQGQAGRARQISSFVRTDGTCQYGTVLLNQFQLDINGCSTRPVDVNPDFRTRVHLEAVDVCVRMVVSTDETVNFESQWASIIAALQILRQFTEILRTSRCPVNIDTCVIRFFILQNCAYVAVVRILIELDAAPASADSRVVAARRTRDCEILRQSVRTQPSSHFGIV